MANKGYVHVYTGNGKGKTTAAFGLAIRSLFAGKNVFIAQFVKSMKYHETQIEQYFSNLIKIEQFGGGCIFNRKPTTNEIEIVQQGWEKVAKLLSSSDYDLIVLDELTIALNLGMLNEEEVIKAIQERTSSIELIITGRYASDALINMADLVTEMKEVKHYYSQGVEARDGIER